MSGGETHACVPRVQMGNKAAFIRFDSECTPAFTQASPRRATGGGGGEGRGGGDCAADVPPPMLRALPQFDAAPHPDVRPMKYAGAVMGGMMGF